MKPILVALLLAIPSYAALVQSKGGVASTRCDSNGAGVSGPPYQLSCSFTTLPTVGNTIIVAAYTYNTTMTAADNQGNTYATVGQIQETTTLPHTYIFIAPVTTSSGTFTVTIEVAANSYMVMHIYEFSGKNNASLVDQTATGQSSSSTNPIDVGPVTTTQANELIFMAVGSLVSAAWSNSGGWTLGEYTDNAATTHNVAWEQWREVTSIQTSYTASMSFSAPTGAYAAVLGTIRDSGGAARRRVVVIN